MSHIRTGPDVQRAEIKDTAERVMRAMSGMYRPDHEHSYTPKTEDYLRCTRLRVFEQIEVRYVEAGGDLRDLRAIRVR